MERINKRTISLTLVRSLKIKPVPPYSFEHTIRKFTKFGIDWYWFTPLEIYKNRSIWTASILKDNNGVAGFKLWSNANGDRVKPIVKVHIYLSTRYTEDQATQAEEMIRRCLCPEEDLSDFYKMAENYSFLKKSSHRLIWNEANTISKSL